MIVVTGATGQLGRLVVEGLKAKLPAEQIVAAVRSPENAADLGVTARKADYSDPATLSQAFAGADKVLLISSNAVGQRVPQHRAVVEAAQEAGVAHIVYTSAPKADSSPLILAPEHKATEEIIRESGLSFTFLRNGWYNENYEPTVRQGAQTGNFVGSAGEGKTSSASRADFADAAVAVLTGEGHENKIYELFGDIAWTRAELAAMISEAAGKPVTYTDLTPEEHTAALLEAGLPEGLAHFTVALDADIKKGLIGEVNGELQRLIGRPTTPMADYVAQIVKSI
ncbi:SDR family oxidoreductase [Amycolatopsis pithecellobii]|uniref:NAD(P)H-binding protein n=1 Tax=Amycolatopsis pithecellobii TaxID=664692 RepID=A0A6N7ZBC0_9PSEU|nr:SDR family oxidoreductase [Amycolatopsis pithecellobii]MTD58975.1 NAD(P)H-binding protein [Amycolatopsis pithecellobii]